MQKNHIHFKFGVLGMAIVSGLAVSQFAQAQQTEEFHLFGSRAASSQNQIDNNKPANEEIATTNSSNDVKPQEFRLFGGNRAPSPPPPPPPPAKAREITNEPMQEFHLFGSRPAVVNSENSNVAPVNNEQVQNEQTIETPQAPETNVIRPDAEVPMPVWQLPDVPQTQGQVESAQSDVNLTNSEPAQVEPTSQAIAPVLPSNNVEVPVEAVVRPNQIEPTTHNDHPAIAAHDESEELLGVDRAMADNIYANGPMAGYGAVISAEGVLYDAGGASPIGQEAVSARFEGFPQGVILERRPEKAMASSGAGATWGAYAIKRDGNQLSEGRYVAIWRKETSGWKIVTELAAGRSIAPSVLPTRPAQPRLPTNTPAVTATPPMRDALGRPVGATQRSQGSN